MNFLILMSDEHNPFYSSVYGHKFVQTPNMQWLADNGTVFENGYCNSPLCVPSRSSFMSGKYVHEIQNYNLCQRIEGDHDSFGRVLSNQGVYTAYSGKQHLYTSSDNLAFNEFIVPYYEYNPKPGGAGIQRKPNYVSKDMPCKRANMYGPKEDAFYRDDPIMQGSLDWLANKAPTIDKPWSLTVNIISPHFPQYVTRDLWDMYEGLEDLPEYGAEQQTAKHPFSKSLRDFFETDQFTNEQVRGLRRGYYGCVTYVDRALGKLRQALEEIGELENTVIAYTSDHGEMLGKFGMWWKSSLLEDSARVPMIVAGPGFEAGKRVKTPVTNLDLQASMFSGFGATRPDDWHGEPLQNIKQNDEQRVGFCEYHGHGMTGSSYMIRKGKWKLLYYIGAPNLLFNLEEDPNELNDVSASQPDKLQELIGELYSICDPQKENDRCQEFIQRQIQPINVTYK